MMDAQNCDAGAIISPFNLGPGNEAFKYIFVTMKLYLTNIL
jgi:hypothetical protein